MRSAVARRALLILPLSIAAAACAPAGPRFAAAAAGLAIGVSETGAVIYRDEAPGQYTISVDTRGIYPNQFTTVILRPGETAHVRVESLSSWSQCGGGINEGGGSGCADTFVVNVIDAASALAEMGSLRFIRG
jgi:hypothetical protein